MSGELEAAGAMATAGLAAGAIEGRTGGGPHGEGACLNCGAQLAGAYCSACGQAAHAHRSLAHMAEEFLHGILHFDTKAWRTFPLLVFRPGALTRNYIYGQRARYISPLALFLFTIFFMFFVFAFAAPFNLNAAPPAASREQAAEQVSEAEERLREMREELAEAMRDPDTPEAALLAQRQGVTLLEAELQRARAAVARIEAQEQAGEQTPTDAPAGGEGASEAAHAVTWQERVSSAARNGKVRVGTPFPELNAKVVHTLENPDLALYKVTNAAYKFSFLLVPISLPFMWLLFAWRRGLTLYDHVVFTLNSLSFASVAFVVAVLCTRVSWLNWVGALLLSAGLPLHMFFHLKGAYALGWWSAIWRSLILYFFAVIALSIFLIAIVFLGLGG